MGHRVSRHVSPPVSSALPHKVSDSRWQALQRQRLHDDRHLVRELGAAGVTPHEEQHYPPEDFIDSQTGAQYFLHCHDTPGLGVTTHVHIFKRWSSPELKAAGLESTTTHLVALELDTDGTPTHCFTVNQWVVGDYWLSADHTVALFEGWGFSGTGIEKAAGWGFWHRWLAAWVEVHLHGVVYDLLQRRDQTLSSRLEAQPEVNVLQDRSIEVFDRITLE